MKNLMIMESPEKARTVMSFLSKDYKVIACKGHVIDLPKSSLGIDKKNGFKPKYIEIRNKKDVIAELKREAANADRILLAPDPDREGEAIAWHLSELLKCPEKTTRVTFNEITKKCVLSSINDTREIDMNLVNSQQARRVLDRLVGYEISPILWKKIKSGLSAGRVQSSVLKMIVDREREIEKFVPVEYWELDALLSTLKPKKKLTAHFYGDINGKLELENNDRIVEIEKELENAQYVVSEYKEGTKSLAPQPPYITSTLQQDASKRLNYKSAKTMSIAQKLYEGVDIKGVGAVGLITYMRTDSVRIADEAIDSVREYILNSYGSKYLPSKPNVYKSKKNSQDAHEAIRPTSIELTPEKVKASLTNEQYKLYKMIFERFVSSQMANAKNATVSVTITANDKYVFKASSSSRVFDGYKIVFEDSDSSKETTLPEMKAGDVLAFNGFDASQHFTQPPQKYTTASMIKEMESNGIGRPSTYSTTITTLTERYYIELDKNNSITPTELGMCVSDVVSKSFPEIVNVKFTASMEEKLDDIENGDNEWQRIIEEFYGPFEKSLKKAEGIEKVNVPVQVSEVPCPKCGEMMIVRTGRYGKFLACPKYPECKSTQPLPENEITVPCPICGGKLIRRRSNKFKTFIGCENYYNNPQCTFTSSGIPTGEKCPECGGYLYKDYKGKTKCNNFNCTMNKKSKKTEKESE